MQAVSYSLKANARSLLYEIRFCLQPDNAECTG